MDELTSRSEAGIADALTEKVLQANSGIDDARLRNIVAHLIRHLHAFVKEAKPTDKEFETAWTLMAEMAKLAGDERNEFLLLCDVIGVSQLVETINHARPQSAVGFTLVGPFYRANAPMRKRGGSVASDDTKGDRVHITGRVFDLTTNAPVAGTILDVWQAATNGLYENQDKNQPDYNLRGRFQADEAGTFRLVALLPTPYRTYRWAGRKTNQTCKATTQPSGAHSFHCFGTEIRNPCYSGLPERGRHYR
jgi:catechol 1,2-dioxygenase